MAAAKAKEAADDKQVTVVGGPNIGRQLLALGLVDELQVAIMLVLIGDGTRLFDHLENTPIKLEKTRIIESGLELIYGLR